MNSTFHLAFKVKDIKSTITFYHTVLGCTLGRQTEHWVDFDFFGHQLSAHVSDSIPQLDFCGKVDDQKVPIPHFGAIVEPELFKAIQDRLEKHKIDFIFKPQKRYSGQKGEQQTMFVLDFSTNPLEFKSFKRKEEIFE